MFVNKNHGRSCPLIETIILMELELYRISSILDKETVHGELLESITAQVADLVHRKAVINDVLRECTIAAEDDFAPNNKKA